ncbi:KAP family P-loop NTPase fold protein [Rhodobacter capsulatus]|uniref:KAP family P-loop NTPase fold protein n=1 Tax=Rhodobacter capsulatus TaxID=1061 RepID=UPI0003D2BDDF|nr:P-loop NTPase fold protein [Rhodobacter capsulatus]ETD80682.1 hypothetical protein U716_12180 [Rhodobacter capsulatus B6]
MRLTLPEPDIEVGKTVFSDNTDWLDRSLFGQSLTDLVDALESPTVIALDGPWGSGKSHFLKLWAGAHKQSFGGKAQVVYFDAFKEDFLDDPLVSLVAAMGERASSENATNMAKVKRAAWKVAKPVLRLGAAFLTGGASEGAAAGVQAVAEQLSDEAGNALDAAEAFWHREDGRRAAMREFIEALREMTAPGDEGTPGSKLVIIVDELDRCRPDYALSLLETIKHFFAVDGVHFVLGVNLRELENSVKARYGDGCHADIYLQKFITLSAALPEAPQDEESPGSTLKYFERICGGLGLAPYITENAQNWLKGWQKTHQLSLRQAERIAARLALMATDRRCSNSERTHLLISLHIIQVLAPGLFDKLRQSPIRNDLFDDVCALFGLEEFRDSQPYGDDWQSKLHFHLWLWALEKASVQPQREFIGRHLPVGPGTLGVSVLRQVLHERLHVWDGSRLASAPRTGE